MVNPAQRIWDDRYSQGSELLSPDSLWPDDLDIQFPSEGSALDVAAGAGRVALWLAGKGLIVTAVDISQAGLDRAAAAAAAADLNLETVLADLETRDLPSGPFDVITCFRYWQRDLFPAMHSRLAPGGIFLAEVFTTNNLERNPHPSPRFLAQPGELRELCSSLEILFYREGWFNGKALARVAARAQPL